MRAISFLLLVATTFCFYGGSNAKWDFLCKQYPYFCKPKCSKMCTKNYDPVCGRYDASGFMKTFGNMCLFEVAKCWGEQWGKTITFVGMGECRETTCPEICTEQYEPVCGSDRRTYSNHCYFKIAACNAKKEGVKMWVVKKGRC